MIKLIVSDLDGTLVPDGGDQLPEEYFETILRLKERGIYFAAATGRHVTGIERLFAPIRDKIFYLADNGAYVGCYGRELFLTEYRYKDAESVFRDMRKLGLQVMVDGADCVYACGANGEFLSWLANGYHFPVKPCQALSEIPRPFTKISACNMTGITEEQEAFFRKKYEGRLKVTLAGVQWLDTMDLAVNKGNAVRLLQESLDIKPEETMAFGDQLNDIEMLNRAYYSFAVANARPETKQAARFLADSNTEHGVLKILRGLL